MCNNVRSKKEYYLDIIETVRDSTPAQLIREGVLPTTGIRRREEYPFKLEINPEDEEVANRMEQAGDCF